jgi:hypothetical protein
MALHTGNRRTTSASPSPRTVSSSADQTPRLGGRQDTSPPASGIPRRRSMSSSRQPSAEDAGRRASNESGGGRGGSSAGEPSPATPRSRLTVQRKPRPPALSAQAQAMAKAKMRDASKPLSPPADAPAPAAPSPRAVLALHATRPSSGLSPPQKGFPSGKGRSPPGPGAAAAQHALDDDDCWTSGDDDGLARVGGAAARQLAPGRGGVAARSPVGFGPWEGTSKDAEPEVSNASWASSPVSVQVRAEFQLFPARACDRKRRLTRQPKKVKGLTLHQQPDRQQIEIGAYVTVTRPEHIPTYPSFHPSIAALGKMRC